MSLNTIKNIFDSAFAKLWFSALGLYFILTSISLATNVVSVFPAWGVIGYTTIILLLIAAMANAEQRWHFITIGLTLVVIGVVASIDIILSREMIIAGLQQTQIEWIKMLANDAESVANLVNILVILLNIFTSSLASSILFYGLNKRNF